MQKLTSFRGTSETKACLDLTSSDISLCLDVFVNGSYTGLLEKHEILLLQLSCCNGGIYLQLARYASQSPRQSGDAMHPPPY